MRKGLSAAALALLLALMLAPTAAAQRGAATACDPFASKACLMPFPNDMNLTVKDRKTPTGLRVHLPQSAMPANKDGKRIAVADYNRNDGFSPGQSIVVRVKGLDSRARVQALAARPALRPRAVVRQARRRRRHQRAHAQAAADLRRARRQRQARERQACC